MKKDIELFLEINKSKLPLISNYWDVSVNENLKRVDLLPLNISDRHNTTSYPTFTFYKPISTIINLEYYE
ncbi:MAG: hypothetical protein IT215_06265 [Chitinophagaceae bacterium]|nr:hypothetical protein [Chitinophagaceae bacterium]